MKLSAPSLLPVLLSVVIDLRGVAPARWHARVSPVTTKALHENASDHATNLSAHDAAEEEASRDFHWQDLAAENDEHRIDALTWKLGRPPQFHGQLPPKCPRDIAWNAQYWYNTAHPDKHHTICKYADNCMRVVSNQDRLHAIRKVLAVTKNMLDANSIPYILYGGTAIGQARCKDVLAWDNDCDVVVTRSDLPKLSSAGHVPYGYELMPFTTVIPYKVVDQSTGYYCDIFQMEVEAHTNKIAIPWPYATDLCPQFPDTPQSPGNSQHCHKHNVHDVLPISSCEVNGLMHTCARNQDAFLRDTFGPDWRTPDVSTHSG